MVGEVNKHPKWATATRGDTVSVDYSETPSNSTGDKCEIDAIIRAFFEWGLIEVYVHIDRADGQPKVEIKDIKFIPNKP